MPSIHQIRAMLLEESLMHLLRNSGYRTVEYVESDDTLKNGSSGLEVKGRGESHQIDAIADYKASPPFCNPVRLLVEGKFESKKTGIEVIRNAVGVLKDLQEYFIPAKDSKIPAKSRYHYTYAIFSAKEYTKPAQKYAYAQDIYLIPLARSKFFESIFESIQDISKEDFDDLISRGKINISLKELRKQVRSSLKNTYSIQLIENNGNLVQKFKKYIDTCKKIDLAFLAIAGNSFPILLIKNPDVDKESIYRISQIKIHWDDNGWYVSENGRQLFSFDLPKELLDLYERNGELTKELSLDLKQNQFFQFKILIENDNVLKYLTLRLDVNWINQIREKYGSDRNESDSDFQTNDEDKQ